MEKVFSDLAVAHKYVTSIEQAVNLSRLNGGKADTENGFFQKEYCVGNHGVAFETRIDKNEEHKDKLVVSVAVIFFFGDAGGISGEIKIMKTIGKDNWNLFEDIDFTSSEKSYLDAKEAIDIINRFLPTGQSISEMGTCLISPEEVAYPIMSAVMDHIFKCEENQPL